MCGINGILAFHHCADAPITGELVTTRDYMASRGPDGAGAWWSADRRIGLGHRRLAILDTSTRADQPMTSDDGRYVVVFNGEIYNYPALRRELETEGARFRTTSDTEALLHLFARYGEEMLRRLRGMFAFAIWDCRDRRLFLARDPYGIKPLYTASDGWTFRFASQVKALLAGGRVSRDPEPAGIVGFHLWGSVPDPFTLYRDIRALPAGHFQWVDAAGPDVPKAFDSIAAHFAEGSRSPAPQRAAQSEIRECARESVAAHLLSDVEVGIFLSAGVDSGAILGLMRDAGHQRIKAITLAFDEFRGSAEDEAPLAGEIARQYGAEHVVSRVRRADYEKSLPLILDAMDQPSIDGVNTWFVAKAAREAGLKVALSGLGGDELLGGYPSFRDIPRWVSSLRWSRAIPGIGIAARALLAAAGVGARAPKALGLLEYGGTYPGAYLLRRGLFLPFELQTVLNPEIMAAGLDRLNPLARIRASMTPAPGAPSARVAALESANYMRHQLLRDADWAGMAHGVEIRTPLVDIELLRRLSRVTPRISAGAGKHALASAPSAPLPSTIVDRAKTGFGVPTGQWAARSNAHTVERKGAASRAWAHEVYEHALLKPSKSRAREAAAMASAAT